ncbi:MAG: Methyltransferase type 11 [Pedosphaera sp.]|nr:Methyltransferase type 11 [Pedosphaera sp.]
MGNLNQNRSAEIPKYLNLGCGRRFHQDWVNVDFESSNQSVRACNLLEGIPFKEGEFDAVYHSHVLEHFSKPDGKTFLCECYRVLKTGGVLRVAVPDLEQIVRHYLKCLDGALLGDADSALNYEWIMLEMYDQTVRNQSGGEMGKYFCRDKMDNEEFVYARLGQEAKLIRDSFLKTKGASANSGHPMDRKSLLRQVFNPKRCWLMIRKIVFYKSMKELARSQGYAEIGRFRLGGEVHQWMYDRYSLGKLMKECGFSDMRVTTAFESRIAEWNRYELESKDGIVHKPDSLFMEARKA